MTTTITSPPTLGLSARVVAEIRYDLARLGLRQVHLAQRLGVPDAWVSRRIGRGATVHPTIEEVEMMAEAMGLDGSSLILRALGSVR